ncbi:MAG: hypothetical protein D6696_11555, partial [Acidobacteria bacterium]
MKRITTSLSLLVLAAAVAAPAALAQEGSFSGSFKPRKQKPAKVKPVKAKPARDAFAAAGVEEPAPAIGPAVQVGVSPLELTPAPAVEPATELAVEPAEDPGAAAGAETLGPWEVPTLTEDADLSTLSQAIPFERLILPSRSCPGGYAAGATAASSATGS